MNAIHVSLTDEQKGRLERLAGLAGMTPEEFLSLQVGQILTPAKSDFEQVSTRVLVKNARLYQRLSVSATRPWK